MLIKFISLDSSLNKVCLKLQKFEQCIYELKDSSLVPTTVKRYRWEVRCRVPLAVEEEVTSCEAPVNHKIVRPECR